MCDVLTQPWSFYRAAREKEVVDQIIDRNNMKLVKAKQVWRGCVYKTQQASAPARVARVRTHRVLGRRPDCQCHYKKEIFLQSGLNRGAGRVNGF